MCVLLLSVTVTTIVITNVHERVPKWIDDAMRSDIRSMRLFADDDVFPNQRAFHASLSPCNATRSLTCHEQRALVTTLDRSVVHNFLCTTMRSRHNDIHIDTPTCACALRLDGVITVFGAPSVVAKSRRRARVTVEFSFIRSDDAVVNMTVPVRVDVKRHMLLADCDADETPAPRLDDVLTLYDRDVVLFMQALATLE